MAGSTKKKTEVLIDARQEAERTIDKILKKKFLKKGVFKWVLKNARKGIKNRENLRYERSRVFGRVRYIFRNMGAHFTHENVLESPRDIFYLEKNEIFSFMNGTSTTPNLKALVQIRKEQEKEDRSRPDPPGRFETRGLATCSAWVTSQLDVKDPKKARQGLGCYPGFIKGKVQIVLDPKTTVIKKDRIIVAKSTDPSWVMVFPLAKGLLVERGSLLSHSAIIARELGIPTVVAIDGLTEWLKDEDVVEYDGGNGRVRRVDQKNGK